MAKQTEGTAGLKGYVARIYADTDHEAMVKEFDAGCWDTEPEAIAQASIRLGALARTDPSLHWYAYVQPGQWDDDDGLVEWMTDHNSKAAYVDLRGVHHD